ncbi:MAG: hypothetical protein E7625_07230 [Ruminococcaceae bacterium]|nr:hypothetical protein [Oscillospiraceae bacterium]
MPDNFHTTPSTGDTTDNEVNGTIPEHPNQSNVDYLKGDVWQAIKDLNHMYYDALLDGYRGRLDYMGLPLTFLQEENVLINTEDGLIVNGKQPDELYRPLICHAYVDETTTDNEVYLLVQYQSDHVKSNQASDHIYVGVWLLRYDLDAEDYETFVKLNGDFRIRTFVQEMDKQYEPIVVHKSVIRHDLIAQLGMGSTKLDKTQWGTPNVFVANIDYDNQIITYAEKSKEGFRYYQVDMRKTNNWEKAITRDGLTEEEREASIRVETMYTPIGACLTKFTVNGWTAGLTNKQVEEAFKNSQDIREWKEINIGSNVKENYYAK